MYFLEARVRGRVERWPLASQPVRVGRDPSCDISIDDATLSREHLSVEISADGVRVEDLGSTNGLRVDGDRVVSARLGPERWFVAGSVLLTVREGISLTGDLESLARELEPRARARPATITRDALVPDRAAAAEIEGADLTELAERLASASTRDGALQALVEHALAHWPDVEGAALVRKLDGGLEILGASGSPLPPDACPIVGDEAGRRRPRLVVHPAGAAQQVSPLGALLEAIASCLAAAEAGRPTLREATETPRGAIDAPKASIAEPLFLHVSASCRDVLAEVDRLAGTQIPVLLRGESGTGKEVLARRMHVRSPRSAGPFVALNCAALPSELLEAELFGIERGVATGVDARSGRLVEASGGTFLLDEIGDLPPRLQPKLLRVLESRSVRPVGAPAEIPLDVRLIASTHRDLEAMVREGSFREDLYHRIAGAVVTIPPLRERREDVIPLARAFLRETATEQGRPCSGLDLDAARRLVEYRWPGNVRELRHVVARAVALSDGPIVAAAALPEGLALDADEGAADVVLSLRQDLRTARREFERLYFEQLLERCRGNLSEAARSAGVTRSHLYSKLEELGLR